MVAGDWREFRAKLIMRTDGVPSGARRSEDNRRLLEIESPSLAAEGLWAHGVAAPETGGVLLASNEAPALLNDEKIFQAVVLLTSHGPEGSVGLMLNRPTGMRLGRRPGGLPLQMEGAEAEVQRVFADNPIYCGGFTAQQVIHLLHGHRLPGSVAVAPGVHLAGQAAAAEGVAGGRLRPEDFKFFAGALVWGPGELEGEVAAGAWYPAACCRALVLKPAQRLPVPLWREVLLLMGGPYAQVAAEGYEGDE